MKLKKVRSVAIAILPDVRVVIDYIYSIQQANATTDPDQAITSGIEMGFTIARTLLEEKYIHIANILCAIHEKSLDELEDMEFEDVVKLVKKMLADTGIMSFFPSFASLALKIRQDT